ncbi:DHA2 family efflux MFS transporter permease subunit [Cryobacterium psychrotolerans]|uniref:DHA2 family efflux MFS transporter permease subunit n=1 Tax=Cryobacterium psychrotolerans TaxID=386301 RepID=UPI000B89843F|nr:DHA2 family efflux MFS transporter permease subunit [Cryobacterium psychrotolerans]TFD82971.1 DHA2 family efflux MFS transporter permease subunit [Cryobacterium psychrotolerans]
MTGDSPAVRASAADARAARRRWTGLVFISIAVALIIVDSTIVNVAIPSIVDDLDINSTQVQWVQESYTLVFAALLLVFGTFADRFGRRRILLLGVVLFAVASVFAALAQTGDLLIASRLVQGVGGAMVLPATLSLLNATFRGRERGIAFAIWGSTIGGMVAVGPLLGGWLTTYYSWRWAFGINVPLGVIIIVGVLLFVTESKEAGAPRRVDVVGAVLSVLASGSLVFGLIEGRSYGWWLTDNPPTVGDWTWPYELSIIPIVFLVTIVSGVAFVWWGLYRQRAGKTTLLAFSLFTIPSFRNGNIAALIVSLGEFGIILSLPLWLQNVLGYDALQTGFVLLALALGAFVASGLAGAFGNKISPATIVRAGILAEIVGVAGLGVVISAEATWLVVVPFLFVYGLGVGLATAQLTGVALKDVPIEQSGQGSGTASTSRQIGSALGIAILGTVLFTSVGASLDAKLADVPGVPASVRTEIVDVVVDSAGSAIPALEKRSPELADAARDAFSDGTRYSAFAAAGFLLLGFLASLRLSGLAPHHEPEGPTGGEPAATRKAAGSA